MDAGTDETRPARTPIAALPAPATKGTVATARRELVASLITSLDREARGQVVIVTHHLEDWAAVVFTCDVLAGVLEADGVQATEPEPARRLAKSVASRADVDVVEDAPELALGLLAGSLMLNGSELPGEVRSWLERTLGAHFAPAPFQELRPSESPRPVTASSVSAILDAWPAGLDRSSLTFELAEEWLLRAPIVGPGTVPDAGLTRLLFDRVLMHRLDCDRRALSWMAAFWKASGTIELAREAESAVAHLSEPQYAVPSDPYFQALASCSLIAARNELLATR